LFLLILAREMIKDLENITGDLAQNYKTVPILYGPRTSKICISILIVLTLLPSYLLITKFDVGYMYLYFIGSSLLLIFSLAILWKSSSKKHYVLLHNILKFIIIVGVFSILLIDIDLILNRFQQWNII